MPPIRWPAEQYNQTMGDVVAARWREPVEALERREAALRGRGEGTGPAPLGSVYQRLEADAARPVTPQQPSGLPSLEELLAMVTGRQPQAAATQAPPDRVSQLASTEEPTATPPRQPSLAEFLPSTETLAAGYRPTRQTIAMPSGPAQGALAGVPDDEDPAGPAGPAGADPGDLEGFARAEARRLGIDEDVAVAVANTEGGFGAPNRQNQHGAPAYGPYQLFIGGPDSPGLGDEALRRGIDPRNPAHARAAIRFALQHAARNGWGAFQGAAAAGIGDWDGIGGAAGQAAAAAPRATAQPPAAAPSGEGWQGRYGARGLTPNQIEEGTAQGLSWDEALAVCGPAAAVAFARANGRTPSLREAVDLAREMKVWDSSTGMYGPANQVRLLERMGVPSRLEEGADWERIRQEVAAGRPVIVDTPQHYFVVSGVNDDGTFELGASAGVLRRARGRTAFRPEEIEGLGMGAPRATIYMGGRP